MATATVVVGQYSRVTLLPSDVIDFALLPAQRLLAGNVSCDLEVTNESAHCWGKIQRYNKYIYFIKTVFEAQELIINSTLFTLDLRLTYIYQWTTLRSDLIIVKLALMQIWMLHSLFLPWTPSYCTQCFFQDTSPTLYDVNEIEQSRRPYESAQLQPKAKCYFWQLLPAKLAEIDILPARTRGLGLVFWWGLWVICRTNSERLGIWISLGSAFFAFFFCCC